MAKEITFQLTLDIPGCSIMYAPTIELAKWTLSRRQVNLIVSSDILPDGNIARLKPNLARLKDPPDLVVVGGLGLKDRQLFDGSNYRFSDSRCIEAKPSEHNELEKVISSLGEDIRNDLNNPLQAIVAMAFVAQSNKSAPTVIDQALDSIEKVAKKMSSIVNDLEEKIRSKVSTVAGSSLKP